MTERRETAAEQREAEQMQLDYALKTAGFDVQKKPEGHEKKAYYHEGTHVATKEITSNQGNTHAIEIVYSVNGRKNTDIKLYYDDEPLLGNHDFNLVEIKTNIRTLWEMATFDREMGGYVDEKTDEYAAFLEEINAALSKFSY